MPTTYYRLRNLGMAALPPDSSPPSSNETPQHETHAAATVVGGDTALDNPDTGTYAEFTNSYQSTIRAGGSDGSSFIGGYWNANPVQILTATLEIDPPLPLGASVTGVTIEGSAGITSSWPHNTAIYGQEANNVLADMEV